VSGARTAGWRLVSASVRGTSHQRTGAPNQDAHAHLALDGGAAVVAVADGAGSASESQAGSRAAVDAAAAAVAAAWSGVPQGEAAWAPLLNAALDAGRGAAAATAAERGLELREVACTLIVAVLTPDAVAVVQAGDGAVVACLPDGSLRALTQPAGGEFANDTLFVTAPDAMEAAQRVVWEGTARHLAVFTDGLQALALKIPGHEPHAPFFAPLFAFAAEVADAAEAEAEMCAFLSGPRVTARSDDDLTLVLATLDAG
jgi:hypothetical protein